MRTKLLLLLLLANFSIYAQINLVPNGGFETFTGGNPANWTRVNAGVETNDAFGDISMKLYYVDASPKITTQVPLKGGVTYTVKYKYKYLTANYSGDHPISLKISQTGSSSSMSSSTFAKNNEWTEKETTFTADLDMSFELSISTFSFDSEPFNILIDDVRVYVEGTEQYTLIPDLNFEKKLISLGFDSGSPDGKVLTNDINTVTSLDLYGSNITDVTGIQDFTELTTLAVTSNKITILDLSKNTKLKILDCGSNPLTKLDLSNNLALTVLSCNANGLTNLDLSNNVLLSSLQCINNNLTSLDISKLIYLKNLECIGNKLTALNTSNNTELSSINFSYNKVASFDPSKNTKLTSIICYENALETLDLSKNVLLTKIDCSNNKSLKELNLKNGQNNLIKQADLNLKGNLSLNCILVDNEANANTNWANSKDATTSFSETVCAEPKYTLIPDVNFEKYLIAMKVDGVLDGKVITNKIANITSVSLYTSNGDPQISDLTGIADFTALEELSLPPNDRSAIKTLDLSKNTKLKKLNCTSGVLETLNISNCLELKELNVNYNNLTSLDVSNNKTLTYIECSSNKLTSLDVSKNTNLTKLNCSFNQLTALDISKNSALTILEVAANKVKTLDVSSNLNLTNLTCNQNSMSSLNVSKNTALTTLTCNNNSLVSLDISSSPNLKSVITSRNSLTAFSTSNNPELTLIDFGYNRVTSFDASSNTKLITLNCYDNALGTLDVSKNQALTVLDCGKNQFPSLDLSKNTLITTLKCADSNYLTELNVKNGKNTLLITSNLSFLNNQILNCILVDDETYSNTNWTAKKDATASFSTTTCAEPVYTLIPDINFEKSLMTKGIDLIQDGKVLTSKIAAVKSLDLSNYSSQKIQDFTGIEDFTALEELKLPYNSDLKSINISHNLALKKLDCSYNKLTSLDVSNNLALTELICNSNNLTTINVSKNVELTKLDCSYNRLTSLDVTNNTKLTYLSCSASNTEGVYTMEQGLLTSLDLSKNIALDYLDCSWNDKITGLDVSKNINLTSINVSYNKLTTIDFSANKLLKSLRFNNNDVTSIDLSKYPNLESLDCSSNKLTVLDVSQKPALKRLLCADNQLTNIDVSKNPLLETIYCNSTKIASLDLSANPNLKQILCSSNINLTKLNLKNGNNTKLDKNFYSDFSNNPNLSCITVDDVVYANTNWAKYKDAIASYNTECGFSLPSKNFAIETKGESCLGENNGEINITATAQLPYTVTVNGIQKTFTNNSLKVTSLTPGIYAVIIAVPGEVYEQTFNITIAKGATITGKSTTTTKKVDVEITEGTAPFTVFIDGTEQFQTSDASFSLDLNKGGLIEVTTAKACEGVFSKKIVTSDLLGTVAAYPNPTTGSFEIEVPSDKNEVKIELYNFAGQLVSTKTYTIESGKAQLNLENQPSGIYAAKIYLETPEYIKIIKI